MLVILNVHLITYLNNYSYSIFSNDRREKESSNRVHLTATMAREELGKASRVHV